MATAIPTRHRTQYGWGYWGERVYSRPGEYKRKSLIVSIIKSFVTIDILTTTGILLTKIRTDIERPILKSLRFDIELTGCAGSEIVLNDLPAYDLPAGSIIKIYVDNDTSPWYCGTLNYSSKKSLSKKEYKIEGFGLRKQLDLLRAETTYPVNSDYGAIVADIAQNYIAPFSSIKYNAAKIDQSTGRLSHGDMEFSKDSITKILGVLADLSQCYWGVDGEGELYFERKPESDEIVKTLFAGYQVNDLEIDLNFDAIRNSAFIQRQKSKAEGGSGWTVAAIANDYTSQKLYGIREIKLTVPGSFASGDCQLLADSIVSGQANPAYSAKISDYHIESKNDYLERGNYRIITPVDEYSTTIQSCEHYTDWTITGTGDLVLSDETTIIAEGVSSLKMSFAAASGQAITYNLPEVMKGNFQRINFYSRAAEIGYNLDFSVNSNMYPLSYPVADAFIPFTVDVSGISGTVNQIGFVVQAGDNDIYIDKIELIRRGCAHYTVELNRSTYDFSNGGMIVTSEFGTVIHELADNITDLLNIATEAKSAGEIR